MTATVKQLTDWGDKMVTPMAWARVSLRLAKEFRDKQQLNLLVENTVIENDILIKAAKEFDNLFNVKLPEDFFLPMKHLQLRGYYLKYRNAYIAEKEPLIYHCNHYNVFLLALIEDAKEYIDVYAILIDSAHEIAYQQFTSYFETRDIASISDKKAIVEDYYKFCGFGKIDLSNINNGIGTVHSKSDHYGEAWKIKFGFRNPNEPGVSFFSIGFILGALESIYEMDYGRLEGSQSSCISKGEKESMFEIYLRNNSVQYEKSPEEGSFQTMVMVNPDETDVDFLAIRRAIIEMNIQGSEQKGLIDCFGVFLTNTYANYYCLISYRFLKGLEEKIGDEGRVLATQLLIEAGHVCAFHTFGGIMESTEWYALIKPMIKSKEDWVYGIIAIANTLGWGCYELKELIPNKKLVVKITSGYEANSYIKKYGPTSKYPISFLATGGCAGIMNLIYHGDISERPNLNEEYYHQIFNTEGKFVGKQVQCRAMGDNYDIIEVNKS